MGLYTFLYGNPLYRLYTIHIQPARIVPARLSRYTAHTASLRLLPCAKATPCLPKDPEKHGMYLVNC